MRTCDLSSGDVPFQKPPPGQQGQRSHSLPNAPRKNPRLCPYPSLDTPPPTHTHSLPPYLTAVSCCLGYQSQQPPRTHHLVSFLMDSPLGLGSLRLTSFTCPLSRLLWWPKSANIRPTLYRNDMKVKKIILPHP